MKTNAQTIVGLSGNTGETNPEPTTGSLKKEGCGEQARTFSSVDLWNIQRQRRTFIIR